MQKSAKIAIIAGICAAIIIGGLALFVHFKLSEVEKNETGKESAEQIAKEATEVLSGKPHSEANEAAESNESAETGNEAIESTEPSVNDTDSTLDPEANESAEEHASESGVQP
ncbi:MAG: hypothetical protein ACKOCQ_00605 [Candidatus Nitrosotenuis sp.]